MIIYKITNVKNNRVYINYKQDNVVHLNVIKNKQFKKDYKGLNKSFFNIEIIYSSNDKETIKKEFKKILYNELENKTDLYNSLNIGKIVVKDENGNNIKISVNDKRYVFGELHHVSKGKITVIDKETNKYLTVYEDDPLYKIRYFPVTCGKVLVKDKDNNHFLIDKNDSRYGKELVFICAGNKISKNRHNNLLNTNLNKRSKLFENFHYKINHDNKNRNYIIKNFCKHGDLIIKSSIFNKLYNIEHNYEHYCEKCRNEYYEKYVYDEKELHHFQNLYKDNNINLFIESYVKNYLYKLYFYINYFNKNKNLSWEEKVYLFRNNINNIPLCLHKDCDKIPKYSYGNKKYNLYCDFHFNSLNYSSKEKDVLDFIKTNYNGVCFNNYREFKSELDIYIPEFGLALEFNGIYWHSDKFKEHDYHYNKWKLCKENGIKLLQIWEDDWDCKQDIIKSIILNSLNLTQNKLYARKTSIKEVTDPKYFLNENHLQGWCQSSINIGLYYNDDLVSLMTFGKRKISGSDTHELLRFCSKLNTNIIGAASKLFNFFINNYEFNNIISYASCDISDGSIYKILGFKEIGHTGLNYWWFKDGKKYHRSKFMKHKLVKEGFDISKTENEIMKEQGFLKIYGSGNLKFLFSKTL